IWRFLDEDNLAGKLDVKRKYSLSGRAAELKFGGGYTYKERDYQIKGFQFIPQGVTLSGDPNELFAPENLWPMNGSGTQGTRYEPGFLPNNTNQYNGTVTNTAMYVSNEFSVSEKFKTILGVRMEGYVQNYTGLNQQGLRLDNVEVLNDLDFFPSVNLIYSLKEKQNLRLSYSRTVARPSFKEASFAEIFDPLTGRTFIGGFFKDVDALGNVIRDGDLSATRINNLDLRWEAFQNRGQMISFSTFFKSFDNPIEIIQFIQAPNNFQPRNVGDGKVFGVELEARQNLDIISNKLDAFSINANLTLTESQIRMSETEFTSRLGSARTGETIKNTREMAGQAPYLINVGLTYNQIEKGLEAGFYYNVQGETLSYVGVADRPDVYSVPFHSLNFNANKNIGERMRVGIGASNLLDAERKLVFKSFGSDDKTFSSLRPGTRISFSFSYNFK
ncbi:MAG TPA: TonB-dependent receptor, partial [Cyclobacteriaceae bacterium]|nr:TonB-dependent receptor [Cyclobacteriaceae bacterium]